MQMDGTYVPVLPPAAPCEDTPPQGKYSCYQQAVLFGSCDQPWMNGFCKISCGKCSKDGSPLVKPPSATPAAGASGCADIAPDDKYTCEQQKAWGKASNPSAFPTRGWVHVLIIRGEMTMIVTLLIRCLQRCAQHKP